MNQVLFLIQLRMAQKNCGKRIIHFRDDIRLHISCETVTII